MLLLASWLFPFASTCIAQPGPQPIPHTYEFKFYTPNGELITPRTKRTQVNFEIDTGKRFCERGVINDSLGHATFKSGAYHLPIIGMSGMLMVPSKYPVRISIIHKKETMSIRTSSWLDSVVFQPGKYVFTDEDVRVFSHTSVYNNAKISNLTFDNYHVDNNATNVSHYINYEYTDNIIRDNIQDCLSFVKHIETNHGKGTWISNICNNRYDGNDYIEQFSLIKNMSNDSSRFRYYPINQTQIIKHHFNLNDNYSHTFSISNNFGESYEKLITVQGDWHTAFTYFPELNKVGILGQDILLMASTNDLINWEYLRLSHDMYGQMINDKSLVENANNMLVLFAKNWHENAFHKIWIKR